MRAVPRSDANWRSRSLCCVVVQAADGLALWAGPSSYVRGRLGAGAEADTPQVSSMSMAQWPVGSMSVAGLAWAYRKRFMLNGFWAEPMTVSSWLKAPRPGA